VIVSTAVAQRRALFVLALTLVVGASRFVTETWAAGAFAVGKCGAYGYAYDYRTAGEALVAAQAKCTGSNCTVVAAMQRDCAAFAIDARRPCGANGWATAPQLGGAQNAALRECYRHGGKTCVIRSFVCDAKG
jgi:hypothetical protein